MSVADITGRSSSSPIAPSTARQRNEVLSSTALRTWPNSRRKLRSRGTLRRPRDVGHHPEVHIVDSIRRTPFKPDAFSKRENTDLPQAPKPEVFEFIPGPKLRAKLGISAVTLWRWRHDKEKGFPAPKVINGRLYFALGAVMAWLARQADAA